MATTDELARRLKLALDRAQFADWSRMYTGRRTSTGITLSGADTGRVWVRADENSREETQVWGNATRINIPVWVGPNVAGELEIKTLEQTEAALVAGQGAAASILPAITPDNNDQLIIGGRQFYPGRMGLSILGGLYVRVNAFHYPGGFYAGGDVLLTPPSTADTQAWCALAFNPNDGTFTQFTGTEYALPILMNETDLGSIAITEGYIPVGAVVLYEGQTTIDGSEVWADFHYHFAQAGSAISGFVTLTPGSSTRNTVQPGGDYPALILKNNASQTVAPFQVVDSADAPLASITAAGVITSDTLDINGSGTIRKLLTDASTELTISGGAVTTTQTFHRIDTEADAASDDLDTITAGADGQFLVIRAENAGREVVVTTAGNITTGDGNNVVLDEVYKFLLLVYDGNRSKWNVVGGGGGGAGTYYQTVKDNGSAQTQRSALNLIGGTDITLTIADDSGNDETDVTIAFSGSGSGSTPYSLAQGRLTLTTGVPVTTSDVTAAATLYFTPYKGNQLGLYNGSAWVMFAFSEISLSLAGYTASKPYDIWVYDNSGTVTLDSTVWTDGTTRATALALQDGIYVKSGDATRRYLGTIYITSAGGVTEDSTTKRFVWNYYNRERRALRKGTQSNWTYGTNTWRAANADNTLRVELIAGVSAEVLTLHNIMLGGRTGNPVAFRIAIAEDGTSTPAATCIGAQANTANGTYVTVTARIDIPPAVGYHYYQMVEATNGSTAEFGYAADFSDGLTGTFKG